jgi:hypothetical protein
VFGKPPVIFILSQHFHHITFLEAEVFGVDLQVAVGKEGGGGMKNDGAHALSAIVDVFSNSPLRSKLTHSLSFSCKSK